MRKVALLASRLLGLPYIEIDLQGQQQPRLAVGERPDWFTGEHRATLLECFADHATPTDVVSESCTSPELPSIAPAAALAGCAGAALLTSDGRLAGALMVAAADPQALFSPHDLSTLGHMAGMIGGELDLHARVQRAELDRDAQFEYSRELKQELEFCHIVQAAVALTELELPPAELLLRACELTASVLKVDWAGLASLQGDRAITVSAWNNAAGQQFARATGGGVRRIDGGLLWQAADEDGAIFVDEYLEHDRSHRTLTALGARSVVSVALGTYGDFAYVMTFVRLHRSAAWSSQDRQLVTSVARSLRQSLDRRAAEESVRTAKARLDLALRTAPLILWTTDLAGRFTTAEGNGLLGLGVEQGTGVGRSVEEVCAGAPDVIANVRRTLAGETFTSTTEFGGRVIESNHLPIDGPDGQRLGAMGIGYDVTARVRAEQEERRARKQAEALIALSLLVQDLNQSTRQVAQAALAALDGVLEGSGLVVWQRQPAGFMPIASGGVWTTALQSGAPLGIDDVFLERHGVLKDHRVFLEAGELPITFSAAGALSLALLPVLLEAPGHEIIFGAYRVAPYPAWSAHERDLLTAVGQTLRINGQRRLYQRQTEHAATTDPLTGLGNRRAFEIDLKSAQEIATVSATSFGLLTIDLDGLKAINDRHGHVAGDALLKRFGEQLRATFQEHDRVYRLGGDEFVLVLPGIEQANLSGVMARVQQAMSATARQGHQGVDASAGLACFPEDGTDPRAVLLLSDARMYAEKSRRQAAGASRRVRTSPE